MNTEAERTIVANIDGICVRFFVSDAADTVQKHHHKGEFYEREELELISTWFTSGGSFLDIGANVGNHSIFASKFLNASRLILVEPNPEALAILFCNLALNNLDTDSTIIHQCALSDHRGSGRIVPRYQHNLGASQVIRLTDDKRDADSPIVDLVTGDELIQNEPIDFIKIDVEGHAIEVLRGLRHTIAANRPPIFIEIDDDVLADFESWQAQNRYSVVERFVRYATQANYIVLPTERLTA